MCGIVAVFNFDGAPVSRELLLAMRDEMIHRGPDGAGVYLDGGVGLGHRRLSIIDLSEAGHQPMSNEDGSVWLVFNGEIYNHVELRAELQGKGHRFRSTSDSEVIVHLYEEEGEACVDRMNGMFGFVVWDRPRGKVFAARDRAGIKPFYYYLDGHRLICASEIKAILRDPGVSRAPDARGIADYLFAGVPLAGRTTLDGISQLPPGHTLTLEDGTATVRKFWDVPYRYDELRGQRDTEEELLHLLDDAVRVHCRSDAPLGCHLSGGLDSSSVTSLAAAHRAPFDTFSIRFDEGGIYDETSYAREVASHHGLRYREASARPDDLSELLAALIWHMDSPMMTWGGFSYFIASRLASRHVKVSLTGHGGDEILAGYPAHFATAFGSTSMFASPKGGAATSRRDLARYLSPRRAWRSLGRRLRRLAGEGESGTTTPEEEQWMSLHCSRPPAGNHLLHPDFRRGISGYSPEDDYLEAFREAPTDRLLDRCLYHDLRSYLPGLLHLEDRASMAVSIESRVPLLDYRVIEFLATVPPEQKVAGLVPKALLRRAMAGRLPDRVVRRRDKGAFPVPLDAWMRTELAPLVGEILRSPACLDRGIFDPDRLHPREMSSMAVWGALNIELWCRIFIDRDAALLAVKDNARQSKPSARVA